MDREAPVRRVQARALGHGPALQHAVELEAEVVVQPACGVLLDDEAVTAAGGRAFAAGRLARLPEITLAPVRLEGRRPGRSEEHTSELQSLMRISSAVLCLKIKKQQAISTTTNI